MVETVLAAFATSAGASAAATAAGSLPWLVPSATAGSFALTGSGALASFAAGLPSFGNVFSLFGGLGKISAGNSAAQSYKMQAKQEELNARLETVKAEDTANQLRRNLIADMGSANAIFASRGIGLGAGTPEQAKIVGANNASRNIDNARFGGEMASLDRRVQAGQYRLDAKASRAGGYFNAVRGFRSGLQSLLDF